MLFWTTLTSQHSRGGGGCVGMCRTHTTTLLTTRCKHQDKYISVFVSHIPQCGICESGWEARRCRSHVFQSNKARDATNRRQDCRITRMFNIRNSGHNRCRHRGSTGYFPTGRLFHLINLTTCEDDPPWKGWKLCTK